MHEILEKSKGDPVQGGLLKRVVVPACAKARSSEAGPGHASDLEDKEHSGCTKSKPGTPDSNHGILQADNRESRHMKFCENDGGPTSDASQGTRENPEQGIPNKKRLKPNRAKL